MTAQDLSCASCILIIRVPFPCIFLKQDPPDLSQVRICCRRFTSTMLQSSSPVQSVLPAASVRTFAGRTSRMEFARHSFSHSLLLQPQRKLLTSDASLAMRYACKYWPCAVNFIAQLLSCWCAGNTVGRHSEIQTNANKQVNETLRILRNVCQHYWTVYSSSSNDGSGVDRSSSSCTGISSSCDSIIIFNLLLLMSWYISHKTNYRDGSENTENTSNKKLQTKTLKEKIATNQIRSTCYWIYFEYCLVQFSLHNYTPNNRRAETIWGVSADTTPQCN